MTVEEARQIVRKHTDHLVAKWSKTRLLDGIKNDLSDCNMAVLIESEEKIYVRSEMTEEQRRLDDAYRLLKDTKEKL